MTCPNCKKYSTCGCKSCLTRRGMYRCRAERMYAENVKCPYCKSVYSFDGLLMNTINSLNKQD